MVRSRLEGHERSANTACVRTVHGFCGVAGAAVKLKEEKEKKQPPMGFLQQKHHWLVIYLRDENFEQKGQ